MLRSTLLTASSLCLALAHVSEINSLLEYSILPRTTFGTKVQLNPDLGLSSSVLPSFLEDYTRGNTSLVFDLDPGCRTQLSLRRETEIVRKSTLRLNRTSSLSETQINSSFLLPGKSNATTSRLQNPTEYLSRAASFVYRALTSSSPPLTLLFTLWLYFTGSLFFDIAHYTLHKFSKSQSRILRRIGYLHEVHHLYFNRRLKFNDRYLWQNTAFELPLELGCQLIGTLLGYWVAQALSLTGPGLLSWELLILVMGFEVVRSVVVAVMEGMDSNHMPYEDVVPKDPNAFVVGPEFHAMHHVDPSAYISSSFRVFDWVMGTACTLRGRRVTVAGVEGALGDALKSALEVERTSCVQTLGDSIDAEAIEMLVTTDLLVLGTGTKEAVTLIELFRSHRKARPGSLLLPEVWYIGNDSELLPQARVPQGIEGSTTPMSSFLPHARKYYDAADFIYRHVIMSSLSDERDGSKMDAPGSLVADALWWIKRGARYVPASSTGSAFMGYFNFVYRVKKAP